MNLPLISIFARSAATVREPSVAILLGQSYPNWELLVADDPQAQTSARLEALGGRRKRVSARPGHFLFPYQPVSLFRPCFEHLKAYCL